MSTPVPVRQRSAVLHAIRSAKSLAEAARAVGFTIPELKTYANGQHMGAAVARLEREGTYRPHSGFLDMTDKELAGVTVLRRAVNHNGNARWHVRFTACGHEQVFPGIQLRQVQRDGGLMRCAACREERRSR